MHVDFARLLQRRRRLAAAIAAALSVVLSATAADAQGILQRLFGGGGGGAAQRDENALVIDPTPVTPPYCPEVRISVGGEAMATFDPAHEGEQKYVRYLSSITQTARECRYGPDPLAMNIKLGIAGRVVAGPLGKSGKVPLPVRVTVVKQHGGKVLFNKAYTTTVSISAPSFAADFSDVIEPVAFKRTADDQDLIIYIGFETKG